MYKLDTDFNIIDSFPLPLTPAQSAYSYTVGYLANASMPVNGAVATDATNDLVYTTTSQIGSAVYAINGGNQPFAFDHLGIGPTVDLYGALYNNDLVFGQSSYNAQGLALDQTKNIGYVTPNNTNGNVILFGINGNGGGGGDPHFVGFDGERFDYHGEKDNDYLIYDDGEFKVTARFTEPDLTRFPHMVGMTFMTAINVNGREITPANIQRKSSDEIKFETGLVRGLLEELNFVMGSVHGLEVIKFAKGELIVTLMESGGDHLNISMRLRTRMDNVNATGILGQTWMPKEQRKPNDEFIR